MWYAVETVFIDGKLFDSRRFDYDKNYGVCRCQHDEEPMNGTKREFGNRIEIHTDWFETEELAEKFYNGEITYIHYYDVYYNNSLFNSDVKL